MKSLRQILMEKNEESPDGVLFLKDKDGNDTHAIVGTRHNALPRELSPATLKRINQIKIKHGIYYEGNGGDVKIHEPLFGPKSEYKGSWEPSPSDIDRNNPPEWIHTPLFSNHEENNAVERIMKHHNPGDTLSDTIRRAGYNLLSLRNKGNKYIPEQSHLDSFLRKIGRKFVPMSRKKTTPDKLKLFLSAGESKMWPKDWTTNKSTAASMARSMVNSRQDKIFGSEGGVFVAGSGHILSAQQRAKGLNIPHELIGGSEAQ